MPAGINFKSISVGSTHTCAISSEDKPYCWGSGSGKLGDGESSSKLLPRKVKTIGDGAQYLMPSTIKRISTGGSHTCAVASDDAIYCWGNGGSGQLGDNTATLRLVPTPVYGMAGVQFLQVELAYSSTCALASTGQIYCWGSNGVGQLGNGTTLQSSIPLQTSGGFQYKKIGTQSPSVGSTESNFCAISVDDVAYCWGRGNFGENGNNASINISIPTKVYTQSDGGIMPNTVVNISTGATNNAGRACAVASDDKVYCWGTAGAGDGYTLGNNVFSNTSYNKPQLVVRFDDIPKIYFDDIYSTECHAVVIVSTAQMKCLNGDITLAEGLHDIVVSYNGTIQTLSQSYMYKNIPNPPKNLSAVGKNKSIHLEWDWTPEKPYFTSVSFIIGCKRSSDSTFNDVMFYSCENGAMGTGSGNGGFYLVSDIGGLENGVSYDIRVQAVQNDSYSEYVPANSIVPIQSSYVPSKPVITSTNSTFIYWSAPTDDGGSPVLNYILQVQSGAQTAYTGFGMVRNFIGNVTNSSLANPLNLLSSSTKPLIVKVIAVNANGASEPSEPFVYQLDQPPSTPTNIKVNNTGVDSSMLSWSVPSNNGSPITSYEMRYSTDPSFGDWVDNTANTCISSTPTPPTTSCVVSGLTIGTQYYFQIRALNANGAGDWSIIHATIVGAPDRPVINTVTAGDGTVYVAWTPPNDNGAAINNYILEYSTDPNFASGSTNQANTGTFTYWTLNNAQNGTIYYFRVIATNGRGDSPWSDPASAIPYAPPILTSISPDQGFEMGHELTTITGDNLNGTTSVTIGGNPCITFVVIDINTINCLTPPGSLGPQDVVVTNLGGSDSIIGGYTYGLPSITLDIDQDITFNMTGTNLSKGTISQTQNATVKTDNPGGYTLSLSMSGTEQALTSATTTLPATDASATARELPINTWGHSLIDANNHWTSIPIITYPKQIKKTTTPTINGLSGPGDATPIFYGVNVNTTQPAGIYTGGILYTAVCNL